MKPKKYKWLDNLELPWTIAKGLEEIGTTEVPGEANNKKIVDWASEVGGWEKNFYTKDSIPWCGLYAAVIVLRAKKEVPKNYLRALSWAGFGVTVKPEEAGLGDVLVFTRKGGGHVGFYIAEDADCYHVLGGNQSDKVSITRIKKDRLYSVNRPDYTNKPLTVKKFEILGGGLISENEA